MREELVFEIEAQIEDLRNKIREVKDQLNRIGETEVEVKVKTERARNELKNIKQSLSSLQQTARAQVRLNTQQAVREIEDLRRRLASVRDIKATAKLDSSQVRSELRSIEIQARKARETLNIKGRATISGVQAVSAQLKILEAEARQARAELKNLNKVKLGELVSSVRTAVLSVRGFAAAIGALATVATGAVIAKIGGSFETLRLRLEAVIGDVERARKVFEQFREAAGQTAVPLDRLVNAFIMLTSAGLDVTVQQVVDLANATVILGGSAERFEFVAMALSQMASKGKIAMEELRQQLGEHLPGIAQRVAQQMGLTLQEFYRFVEEGKITVDEFMRYLVRAVSQISQSVDLSSSLQMLTNQFRRALEEIALILSESGVLDFAKTILRDMTEALRSNRDAIILFAQNIIGAFRTVYDTLKSLSPVLKTLILEITTFLSAVFSLAITVVNGLRMVYYALKQDWEAVDELDKQVKQAWSNTQGLLQEMLKVGRTEVDTEIKVKTPTEELKALKEDLKNIDDLSVEVDVKVNEENISKVFNEVSQEAELKVRADTAQAEEKLNDLVERIKEGVDMPVRIQVEGDVAPAWDR